MNLAKLFSTIDTHVCGEPFRIVTQSPIQLDQADIKKNHDLLQQSFHEEKSFILNEPRGHRGMSGCIVTPSKLANYGLLFFNHDGAIFKYGGLVASLTALLETGNLNKNESGFYSIETINGIYELKTNYFKGEVSEVYIECNGAQFLEKRADYDVAMIDDSRIYLIFSLPSSVPSISVDHVTPITKWGRLTTERLAKENVQFDGVIMTEKVESAPNKIRSVTFEKDGSITRSANTDTTVAILTTLRHSSIDLNQLTNESIFGSSITAHYLPNTDNRFSVELKGFITGIHEFIFDEVDPLKNGFILK